MKWTTAVGTIVAAGAVAFASWRVHDWWNEEKAAGRSPLGLSAKSSAAPAGPATRPVAIKLPPAVRPDVFFLPKAAAPGSVQMSLADWVKAYPEFRHDPVDKAGFSVVPLPFRFGKTDTEADPAVANALAFLLCGDLDYSANAYTSRPAYFVFKRSRKQLEAPEGTYDPTNIARLVRDWSATHAVGGVLVKSPQGYVATLQIFDREGKTVHEKAFEQPGEFFKVLGDLSVDALGYFGTPANAELDRFVHRARCEKPDSLDLLGKAAFAEESSPEEFGLYQQILQQDPKFAEVKLWNATERYAGTAEQARYFAGMAGGLEIAPQPQALYDLHAHGGIAAAPWTQIRRWVDRAETLMGADHPAVTACRLRQSILDEAEGSRTHLSREELAKYVKVAAKHPNHRDLLWTLIEVQTDERRINGSAVPLDAELAGSLCITSITNRALPPRGHAAEWLRLAQSARALYRPQQAIEALRRRRDEPNGVQTYPAAMWQADAYMDTGNFSFAIDRYWEAMKLTRYEHERLEAAEKASVCAVFLNRRAVIEDFAANPDLQGQKMPEFYKACLDYLDRKVVSDVAFRRPTGGRVGRLLLAERELAQGGDFSDRARFTVWYGWACVAEVPTTRLEWMLLERYYALQPTLPFADGLYETLDWLFPDDAHFKPLVAAWRAAHADPPLPSAEDVLKNLEITSLSYQLRRHPSWTIIARIRRDLDEGRPDDAKRVLQAYMKNRSFDYDESAAARNSWLLRRVSERSASTDRTR